VINQNLHVQPVALDSVPHRELKLALPVTDWSVGKKLNALFVAAAEFGDVCREYPIVFVRAGKEPDGTDSIAPIAVMGLTQDQNLFLDGGTWRAQYMPAVLRLYPFCIGRIDAERFAICVDMSWSGVGQPEGARLFEADGKQTELLAAVQKQMETLEGEIQRTRLVCKRLQELDLLRDMRFDATLPDGRQHSVDGFMTVDETRMQTLSDEVIGDLHRTGVLGLIHLHWVSMGNMRRLLQWHTEGGSPAPQAANT
jgi:SapC